MTSFAATILQLALALLMSVNNNPVVSIAQRQQAISVATQAIQLATQVLGQTTQYTQPTSPTLPISPVVNTGQIFNSPNPQMNISLDPNVVAQAHFVNPGGTGYVLLAVDLTANSSDVTLDSITFSCGGGACGDANLKMVSVDANPQTWAGSPLNPQIFNPHLLISAGTTKVVELIGDVSAKATVGQGMEWSVIVNQVAINGQGSGNGVSAGIQGQGVFGNALTVAGQTNQSVSLRINGSGGPLTVQSGASVSVSWISVGIPYRCAITLNPTGRVDLIGDGEATSGNVTASAPVVSAPTAFLYVASCPTISTGGPGVEDTVQVNVLPAGTSASTPVSVPPISVQPATPPSVAVSSSLTVSSYVITSGDTATFTWMGTQAGDSFEVDCQPSYGIAVYDVVNNQDFSCVGFNQHPIQSSGSYTLRFTHANSKPVQVEAFLKHNDHIDSSHIITLMINPGSLSAATFVSPVINVVAQLSPPNQASLPLQGSIPLGRFLVTSTGTEGIYLKNVMLKTNGDVGDGISIDYIRMTIGSNPYRNPSENVSNSWANPNTTYTFSFNGQFDRRGFHVYPGDVVDLDISAEIKSAKIGTYSGVVSLVGIQGFGDTTIAPISFSGNVPAQEDLIVK